MSICYLGLGSNLKSPKRQLQQAMSKLLKLPQSRITAISRVYFNPPLGLRAQPMFYNQVIQLQTTYPPHQLLQFCKQIERTQGRVHKKRWGARTIDIDILLYGNKVIHTHQLTIPHPELLNRDFVIVPLMELLNLKESVWIKSKMLGQDPAYVLQTRRRGVRMTYLGR